MNREILENFEETLGHALEYDYEIDEIIEVLKHLIVELENSKE